MLSLSIRVPFDLYYLILFLFLHTSSSRESTSTKRKADELNDNAEPPASKHLKHSNAEPTEEDDISGNWIDSFFQEETMEPPPAPLPPPVVQMQPSPIAPRASASVEKSKAAAIELTAPRPTPANGSASKTELRRSRRLKNRDQTQQQLEVVKPTRFPMASVYVPLAAGSATINGTATQRANLPPSTTTNNNTFAAPSMGPIEYRPSKSVLSSAPTTAGRSYAYNATLPATTTVTASSTTATGGGTLQLSSQLPTSASISSIVDITSASPVSSRSTSPDYNIPNQQISTPSTNRSPSFNVQWAAQQQQLLAHSLARLAQSCRSDGALLTAVNLGGGAFSWPCSEARHDHGEQLPHFREQRDLYYFLELYRQLACNAISCDALLQTCCGLDGANRNASASFNYRTFATTASGSCCAVSTRHFFYHRQQQQLRQQQQQQQQVQWIIPGATMERMVTELLQSKVFAVPQKSTTKFVKQMNLAQCKRSR
jgi:hypothetical protein